VPPDSANPLTLEGDHYESAIQPEGWRQVLGRLTLEGDHDEGQVEREGWTREALLTDPPALPAGISYL
jgi:hypothetical protein